MFYLKNLRQKRVHCCSEAKLPTGEGKVIDVIVWVE